MVPTLGLGLLIGLSTVSHLPTAVFATNFHPSAWQAPAVGLATSQATPETAKPPEPPRPASLLADARNFYSKGDFDHAIQKYQEMLVVQPRSPDAYAGLTRVYLKKKDVPQALDTATKGLQVSDSHVVHVALGEVYFRQGRIFEAEQEWVKVINAGYQDARAYLGLARVSWALSLYATAWTRIEKAHELDPTDPEITGLWIERLSRAERIKYWQQYLAGQTNDDAESRAALQHYLEFMLARARNPGGACRLISKATGTETSLIALRSDPNHIRAYGLAVSVNDKKSTLMLDTGASGILITRGLAEKAGVTRLSDTDIRGIGDKGNRGGYVGLANSLEIGELEFQGCPVQVIEQRSAIGDDGLVGTDVFSAFLVDLDFPNERLRLRELPKRPGETASPINLKTETGIGAAAGDEDKAAPPKGPAVAPSAPRGPQDAYIAPEMKAYTRVYRFGHSLLVPTSIGNAPWKLFLLDTGASRNFISASAAREVTKVHGDPDMTVKGMSGTVKNVYRADKAVMQFGRLRQENQNLVAIDLTHLSDGLGVETSGLLGFETLRMLDIKIDYRDGVVDFSYDPKRWEH